ncbi:alpha/beta hydrolase fold domain-containing protein [Peredibacter sp. HCB2-198]|uniref:alpha/beta hydrolase n=1 Tax=Peredibacter sp. HCB2-198 TaxID=3383025 RepID=UPI0038B50AEB
MANQSIEQYESHPDSRTQKFLDALNASGGKPMEQLSPAEARKVLEDAQKSVKVNLAPAEVSDKTIEVDGQKINLKIVRPENTQEKLPVFIFIHGGGWVLGDYPTHERLIRDIVAGSGAVGVYVDYTRSPEAKYPVALNQIYAATQWVSEHGNEINVDGSRLAVVGNSVGGNMSIATASMAKDKGGPDIRFLLLMWPVTNSFFETESYNQFATNHFLTKGMMKWFWDNYAPDEKDRQTKYASPLQAETSAFKDFPPTLVQTAECDVLRDEGEAFARKLDEAGVTVTTTRYVGMIHDFGLLNPLAELPEVRSHILQASQELKKYLQLH